MNLRENDKVKIVKWSRPQDDRFTTSSYDPPQQPEIGDVGIIVEIPFPDQIMVECMDDNGRVRWLSDFDLDEIEAIG